MTLTPSPRSEAPDEAPPPIPPLPSSLPNLSCDQGGSTYQAYDNVDVTNQFEDEAALIGETPPPLYPKPRLSLMAERRLQRQSKGASGTGLDGAKRRSRSEGPHGRRKARNSMHETTSASKQQYKQPSNERYSMFTGHYSDDEDLKGAKSGSESADSDMEQQKWTKNPLMVRKSRKGEKVSKTDKRRSLHNVEQNGRGNVASTSRQPVLCQDPYSKDFYLPSGKFDSQKAAKFQRMEENRKKRIDIAVTSDEECSPQLRISRLRQRAMQSSNLASKDLESRESLIIVPDQMRNTSQKPHENGYNQTDNAQRASQYDGSRLSKYDDNLNLDNLNGGFYQEYAKHQGVRHNKLPNILPEFLPANRLAGNRVPQSGFHGNASNQAPTTGYNQAQKASDSVNFSRSGSQSQPRGKQTIMPNESPGSKLRSFNEVRPSKPAPLRKAVGAIEIMPRSPNSSTDSLDDLIESNIQYLESEIESGKLKRQSGSGSFVKAAKDVPPVQNLGQGQSASRSVGNVSNDDLRSRIQDPRGYNELRSREIQNRNVTPHGQQYSFPSGSNMKPGIGVPIQDRKHGPMTGSATYSPHMQRKQIDISEDMSKSDTQLNNPNAGHIPGMYTAERSYVPYPVLHKQTGNVVYVQSRDVGQEMISVSDSNLGEMGSESGMFSDVDYDIMVSDRIKKWEKKMTPGEIEERKSSVLNTIKEYESFSDSNTRDSVPDTPLDIRREIRHLMSPTDNSGVGKLSVNLTKSTSSISDAANTTYFEPKVVSSETNLHRIFRVVHEPVQAPVAITESRRINVHQRKKKSSDSMDTNNRNMANMAFSESEVGSNTQQTWPPILVDSDSGVRKSWRMSRYEDELNELKEIVSDNFNDIRKKFDSDVSETDSRRAGSPVSFQVSKIIQRPATSSVTLNIKPATPTQPRSPVIIRRKLSDQTGYQQQPQQTNTRTNMGPPLVPTSMHVSMAPNSTQSHMAPNAIFMAPNVVSMSPYSASMAPNAISMTPNVISMAPHATSMAPNAIPMSHAPTGIILKSEKTQLPVYRTVPVETKSKVTPRPVTMTARDSGRSR